MKTYKVLARREGRFWLLEVTGVGTTQARTLREAPEMAKSLISVLCGLRESSIEIALSTELPAKYQRQVDDAQDAVSRLASQQAATALATRRAARQLVRSLGLSGRDAAAVLGVSPQRVSQLLVE